MTKQVTVHEAKTNLSKLLARVEQGEDVVIARGSKPVAKLMRVEQQKPRKFGLDEGLFEVPDDFDEIWSGEIEDLANAGTGLRESWEREWHQVAEPRAPYDAGRLDQAVERGEERS